MGKSGVFYAIDFNGKCGGEKIQNAIEVALKKNGNAFKTIIVSPEGPDKDKKWILKNSIKIPSNTTLILENCYIFLDDNVRDNLITNLNHKKGNENIHILGIGKPILDGNASNQGREGRFDRSRFMLGIHFVKVKDFSIKNIKIGPTTGHAIVPEDVENGEISDIYLNQDGKQPNQDGITVPGPARNLIIKNIYGNSGDDSVALNALFHKQKKKKNKWRTSFIEGQGGDIENIVIQNIQTRVLESGNNIRLLCGDGRKLRNIRINGVNCLPENKASSSIVFGNAGRYTKKLPDIEDFTDIYISDIHRFTGDKKLLIWIDSPVGNIQISNISINGDWEKAIFVEKGNVLKTLNINNFIFSGKGGNVLEINGIVENLILSGGTVEKIKYFFAGEGEIKNGLIRDIIIEKYSKLTNITGKMNYNLNNIIVKEGDKND